MYDWLRDLWETWHDPDDSTTAWSFIDYLERTGASPWRSVEDELPEDDKGLSDKKRQQYFIRGTDDYYSTSFFSLGMWALLHITHWQPITPLPKEKP